MFNTIKFKITSDNLDEIREDILSKISSLNKIYSYLLHYKGDVAMLRINTTDVDKYNTYTKNQIVSHIIDNIKDKKNSFLQPDVSIMLEMFDPFVYKLAVEQHEKWNRYDIDDLVQMCRLTILKLYAAGYYINSFVVRKSFINDVYMLLRKERRDASGDAMSLDATVADTEDAKLSDLIVDEKYMENLRDSEDSDAKLAVFKEVKELIISMLGERAYRQLLFDYANKTSNHFSAILVRDIKREFQKRGYTKSYFIKKYY